MSVHLFVRSSYTLLQSTIRIPQLVQKAKKDGYTSVALTDHNTMYGAAAFIDACKKEGMHGIIGLETDCFYHDRKVPFLLLAQDNQGYHDLMLLSSWLGDDHEAIDERMLKRMLQHCFLIVYGEGGWFDSELVNDDMDAVREKLTVMKQELGDFDVALSYQETSLWKMRNTSLKRLCYNMHIHTCALNKIYYLHAEDAESYRILNGIRENKNINDASLTKVSGRYFLTKEEMAQLYDADDLQRTDEIARMCRADFNLPKTSLPNYQQKDNIPSDVFLRQLCFYGLNKRLHGKKDIRYENRLNYELSVIIKMHFEDYFLIVYDFILYARKHGIYVGPGRGSAAGSLTAYCLGITMVDPIKYNLLFERFLNPERVSMPDIDTDIPDNRRDDVIQYVYETYGKDHISNIITFGTLGCRQVIHDVGKVMNVSQRDVETLLRCIPSSPPGMTLSKAYKESSRMRQVLNATPALQKLYKTALPLEGLPRHASIHAAGIVMSKLPLHDVIPTVRMGEGMLTSQYEAGYLEERGLIKMDFLGLRNLTIIDEIVQKIHQKEPSFHIMNIPLDTPAVYQLFSSADTTGIFQFESEGMKKVLRRIQPKRFEDLAAVIALYRPASIDSIPAYLENRKHPEKIHYMRKELEPILKETYGIMVYQEQAMLVAEKAAGFSLGKADILRKAMSKKKMDQLQSLRGDFFKGALKNGYSEAEAGTLFDQISKFAGYGFNKSHAVAYSMISYQMAYLKVVYPLYFYPSLLDSVIGDENKTSQYIDECRRRGISVLYPDVNESEKSYASDHHGIRLPLAVLKGIGRHVSDAVIEERMKRGRYQDFFDFTARVLLHQVTRAQIETIIDGGGLDCFHESRRTLKYALDDALRYSELVQIHDDNQITLDLGLINKPNMMRLKDDPDDRMENERNALGFNLGPSPITSLRKKAGIHDPGLATLLTMQGQVSGFTLIRSVRQHRTKRGQMMAFVKCVDETASMDLLIMPSQYTKYGPSLVKGTYIRFHGKMTEDASCIVNQIEFIKKR